MTLIFGVFHLRDLRLLFSSLTGRLKLKTSTFDHHQVPGMTEQLFACPVDAQTVALRVLLIATFHVLKNFTEAIRDWFAATSRTSTSEFPSSSA